MDATKIHQLTMFWIQNDDDVNSVHTRYENETKLSAREISRLRAIGRQPEVISIANWIPHGPPELTELQGLIKLHGVRTRLKSYKKVKIMGVTFCTQRSERNRVTESSGVHYKFINEDGYECHAFGQILGIYRSTPYYQRPAPYKIVLYIRDIKDLDEEMVDPQLTRKGQPFRRIEFRAMSYNLFISADIVTPSNVIFTPVSSDGCQYALHRNLQWQ